MVYSGDISEDKDLMGNLILGGNDESIGNWSKGHYCYTIAENLAETCLCPRALQKVKFNKNEKLDNAISKQNGWVCVYAFDCFQLKLGTKGNRAVRCAQ